MIGAKSEWQSAPDVMDVDTDAQDEAKPEATKEPLNVSEDGGSVSTSAQKSEPLLDGTPSQIENNKTVLVDAPSNPIVEPPAALSAGKTGTAVQGPTFYGGYPIDVAFEAGKLPLDVAIFNSARAAGGDDRIRKYLQAVLLIGGGALVPGMAHALESRCVSKPVWTDRRVFLLHLHRLQAIATPLVPNMEKVQIIPAPKEVDPRILAWKGAAVLGKMEAVTDLWVTAADWVSSLYSIIVRDINS